MKLEFTIFRNFVVFFHTDYTEKQQLLSVFHLKCSILNSVLLQNLPNFLAGLAGKLGQDLANTG
jgi:hypothetical protein